jgi:hypothetical protein
LLFRTGLYLKVHLMIVLSSFQTAKKGILRSPHEIGKY